MDKEDRQAGQFGGAVAFTLTIAFLAGFAVNAIIENAQKKELKPFICKPNTSLNSSSSVMLEDTGLGFYND